jgi:hypothetical protein
METALMMFALFLLLAGLGVLKDSKGLLIAGGAVGIITGAVYFLGESLPAAALLIILGAYFLFSGVEK